MILDQRLRDKINDLFLLTQPAHIQFLNNEKMAPEQRDMKRAELIRERLKLGAGS